MLYCCFNCSVKSAFILSLECPSLITLIVRKVFKLVFFWLIRFIVLFLHDQKPRLCARSRSGGTGGCWQTKTAAQTQKKEAKTCQEHADTSVAPNDTTYGEQRQPPSSPLHICHPPILHIVSVSCHTAAMWETGSKLWWRTENLNSYFCNNGSRVKDSQKMNKIIFHFLQRAPSVENI